jgi:hypothetical protein
MLNCGAHFLTSERFEKTKRRSSVSRSLDPLDAAEPGNLDLVAANEKKQVPPLRRRWRAGSGRNDKAYWGRDEGSMVEKRISHIGGDYSGGKTILGWNKVPATRVAMAMRSLWPWKTLTWRARESSGRLTGRPVRMRAAVGSSAVTEGNCGRSWRGWMKSAAIASWRETAGSSAPLPFPFGKAKLRSE